MNKINTAHCKKTIRTSEIRVHLNLCIGLVCTDVTSVFHQVLQQFASRGRPQHRGVFLLLENACLVANSDAVAEFE